jgi:hypothetical protein
MTNSCPPIQTIPDDQVIVIIPAHNEGDTVADVVRGIKGFRAAEVVVVDDASTDHTIAAARAAGAHVLPLPLQLGAWGAMQTGLRYAYKKGKTIVVTMDADGQHNPEHIVPLLHEFQRHNSDVVIGSCPRRASWQRHLAWKFFRLATGINLDDLTSGFRLYGTQAIKLLASPEATLLDYQDIGVLLLLQKNKLTTLEVPVTMNHRVVGHSRIFFSWFAVCKYLAYSALLSLSRRNHLGPKNNFMLSMQTFFHNTKDDPS